MARGVQVWLSVRLCGACMFSLMEWELTENGEKSSLSQYRIPYFLMNQPQKRLSECCYDKNKHPCGFCAIAAGSAGCKPGQDIPRHIWARVNRIRSKDSGGNPADHLQGHVPGSCFQACRQHHPQWGT